MSRKLKFLITLIALMLLAMTFAACNVTYPGSTSYTLSVTHTEGGTVTEGGIILEGTEVTLEVLSIDSGYKFAGWYVAGFAIGYQPILNIVMPSCNLTIEARFERHINRVHLEKSGNGTVTGFGRFESGELITITATPDEHWAFEAWYYVDEYIFTESARLFSDEADVSFYMPIAEVVVCAVFVEVEYDLALTVLPTEGGTVTGQGNYTYGTRAELTATPNEFYKFDGWFKDGTMLSDEETFKYLIKGDTEIEARFSKVQFEITVTTVGEGSVVGDGKYAHGSDVTLTATPAQGYAFAYFYNAENSEYYYDAEYTITVSGNITIEAVFTVANGYFDGDGTLDNPFVIMVKEQLYYFANQVNTVNDYSINKYFILGTDINLGGAEWIPVGYYFNVSNKVTDFRAFRGSFDGDGYTISNFVVNEECFDTLESMSSSNFFAGFFGYAYCANIMNLNVEEFTINVTLSSGTLYAGGLIGYAKSITDYYSITNCHIEGDITVSGATLVCGGMAGETTYGNIDLCSADVNVSASSTSRSRASGFVGHFSVGTMTNCYALGNVTFTTTTTNSNSDIGGLIGQIATASVNNCYATGNVTGTVGYVNGGGLIGFATGPVTIDYCFATGDVNVTSASATGSAGGLVGYVSTYKIDFAYCYATGEAYVKSGNVANAGGLIGLSRATAGSTIKDCYALGDATAISTSTTSTATNIYDLVNAGGLVGHSTHTITNSYSMGNVYAESARRNVRAGGIVGHNGGSIANCLTGAETVTANQLNASGLIYVNWAHASGSSNSCYYIKGISVKEIKTLNKKDITPAASQGKNVTDLNKNFFTALNWSIDVWNLDNIDFADGKYPTLIFA